MPIAAARARFARAAGCASAAVIASRKEFAGTAKAKGVAGVQPAGKAMPAKLPGAQSAQDPGNWSEYSDELQLNRNYANGRRREYKAITLLREAGFECIRAPGSKGHWDIIAWNDAQIRFVQVKSDRPRKEELKTLTQALIPRSGTKEVWIFRPNKPLQIVKIVPHD